MDEFTSGASEDSSQRQTPETYQIEHITKVAERVLRDIRDRGKEPELPTGLTLLDENIWGLHRTELLCLAAKPGEGKTTLALQWAHFLAISEKKVLFVSLEMTSEQLVERMFIQMTQFDAWDLRTGANREEFFNKIKPFVEGLHELGLIFSNCVGYTINEIRQILSDIESNNGYCPDVMFIDFIQLIAPENGVPKHEAIAEYLRSLKELAMEKNMAIVVCSQMNRAVYGNKERRPSLHNLKGSSGLEELSDCVIMCWWEELGQVENPTGTKYWLLIEKQRHGQPGIAVPVIFDPRHLTFSSKDVEKPEFEPSQIHMGGGDRASGN